MTASWFAHKLTRTLLLRERGAFRNVALLFAHCFGRNTG